MLVHVHEHPNPVSLLELDVRVVTTLGRERLRVDVTGDGKEGPRGVLLPLSDGLSPVLPRHAAHVCRSDSDDANGQALVRAWLAQLEELDLKVVLAVVEREATGKGGPVLVRTATDPFCLELVCGELDTDVAPVVVPEEHCEEGEGARGNGGEGEVRRVVGVLSYRQRCHLLV